MLNGIDVSFNLCPHLHHPHNFYLKNDYSSEAHTSGLHHSSPPLEMSIHLLSAASIWNSKCAFRLWLMFRDHNHTSYIHITTMITGQSTAHQFLRGRKGKQRRLQHFHMNSHWSGPKMTLLLKMVGSITSSATQTDVSTCQEEEGLKTGHSKQCHSSVEVAWSKPNVLRPNSFWLWGFLDSSSHWSLSQF